MCVCVGVGGWWVWVGVGGWWVWVGVWEGRGRDDLRDKHIQDITERFEKIPTCLTGADLSHKHLSIG